MKCNNIIIDTTQEKQTMNELLSILAENWYLFPLMAGVYGYIYYESKALNKKNRESKN